MHSDLSAIEKKWQTAWEKAKIAYAEPQGGKKKFYLIFAYPGISGFLHVGHMRGYTYADIIARYKRMAGMNVLFPAGTHPSGNQAITLAAKIKSKNPQWIEYLKDNGCSPSEIKQLENPLATVKFFNQKYLKTWKSFGLLIDDRRFISTIDPGYHKFIEWQFETLKEKKLLTQKPYFTPACPNCGPVAVDPSETDIAKGGHAEKIEYTLLKFKFQDAFLIAATLRPETIYGQTNLWINPEAHYAMVQNGNEQWIVAKDALSNMVAQFPTLRLIKDIPVSELLGKRATFEFLNRTLPILPAQFVQPKIGTGIVTSVPSDAPYDYIALQELMKSPAVLTRYHVDPEIMNALEPIQIIILHGYGKFPAAEICEKKKITSLSQKDQLEEATKIIYKESFHDGFMVDACGPFAKERVEDAKEAIRMELIEKNHAATLYGLSEEVICRCGREVIVKRLDNQWFIRYSDKRIKEATKKHIASMSIFPQEYKGNLPPIIDWFDDRACARIGNWLGTRLPFDREWIIEPIADSTLYPAYYCVSKSVYEKKVKVSDLTREFFDYVFLDKKPKKIPQSWKAVKEDFDYFYPLDLNLGGKEHQTVHFPVFLLNHLAIMQKRFLPKGIFVNWWVTGTAGKISKSKGGAEPLADAIQKYGVDTMRLYYSHIASPHADLVWDSDAVLTYRSTLTKLFSLVEDCLSMKTSSSSMVDHFLVSRLQSTLMNVTHAMESYELRQAADLGVFTFMKDLRWYIRRGGKNKKIVREALETWAVMIAPMIPHLAEEIWSRLGKKSLIAAASWPKANPKRINEHAEQGEALLARVLEDCANIKKLIKFEAKKATMYCAEAWKYKLFQKLKQEKSKSMGELMKKFAPQCPGDITKIIQGFITSKLDMRMLLPAEYEHALLRDAISFIQQETKLEMSIEKADRASEPKAKSALPGKPSIVLS